MTAPFRIATRGSALARRQAGHVAGRLGPLLAPRRVELVEIQTTGDQSRDQSLTAIGGEGVFTKEIQQAVLAGRAELAVHSLKDLPTAVTPELVLVAVPERASPHDVLISRQSRRFDALPREASVATGSSRRRAQLRLRRPDLKVVDIRGNVDTRLRKLAEQELDGLVLAEAGLQRLGLEAQITEVLDWMLPAVGQGALGLECRADDGETRRLVGRLDHPPTHRAVLAERAFLRDLGGGCLLPIAALGLVRDDALVLEGAVFSPDGAERRHGKLRGPAARAEQLGSELAQQLLAQGAAQLLTIK